jgi:Lar family restriction alleviation protein
MTAPFTVSNAKPCPFCGNKGMTVCEGETYRWRVAICDFCGAQAPDVRYSIGDGQTLEHALADADKRAVDAWNERALDNA